MPDEQRADAVRELTDLYPAAKTATIAGRTIEIKRCTLAQGARIVELGFPLWASLGESGDYWKLFDERPDEVAALIAAATGLDAAWIAGLEQIDRADLAAAWLEANADFFVRRLLPTMRRMGMAMQTLNGGGRT